MLFSTCTKLRKFTLLGHNLPDFIESLLQCELPLTYLRIPRCRSEEGLYCIAQQFSSLLTLEVSGPAVTDLVLAGIAGGCPLLESLNVACSEQFSVDAFVTLTRACRKLRIVNLRQCRQINDYAVSSLAENCRGLERVDLCGLSLLTDSSMETLGQKSRQLRYLDVSLCSQVTVVGVDAVLWGCKKLAVLEVRGCTRAAQVLAFRAMQNTRWSCDEEWH
jgi:F-box/leucine-rich repeat protein 2/20